MMLVREIGVSCVNEVIFRLPKCRNRLMHDRVVKDLRDNRCKLVSIVFPQPMGELIRVCSASFRVKQEQFDIKIRDSSSSRSLKWD